MAYVQNVGDPKIRTFDANTNRWGEISTPAEPQLYSVIAKRNGKVLLVGGIETRTIHGELWRMPSKRVQEYDPQTGAWSRLEDIQRVVNSRIGKYFESGDSGYIAARLTTNNSAQLTLPENMPGFAYRIR